MKIAFAEPDLPRSGAAVVGICEERVLTPAARRLDEATDGAITRALAGAARFSGKKGELLPIVAPAKLPLSRIVLAGLGKPEQADAPHLRGAGRGARGPFERRRRKRGDSRRRRRRRECRSPLPTPRRRSPSARRCGPIASTNTRQSKSRNRKPSLAQLTVLSDAADAAQRAYRPLEQAVAAVFFTRDLVSEPANVIYPETLAEAGAFARKVRGRGRGARRKGNARTRNGRACSASPRAALGRRGSSSCNGTAPARRLGGPHRSPLSARASPSTPAASRSSPPPAWAT